MPFDPNSAQLDEGFVPVGGPRNALTPKVMYTAPAAPPKSSTAVNWRAPTEEELKQYPGASQISDHGQVRYAPSGKAGADLSDNARSALVDNYLTDKDLPQTGMGGIDLKVGVLNDVGNRLEALGKTGSDLTGATAEWQANKGSLINMVKSRSQIASFEGTVQDSMALALEQANKALSNTGFRTFNQLSNWYKAETQDPDYRGLKNAVDTVTQEYAKVISGATNGAVTSDAARTHAAEMLSTADSPQAFRAALVILQKDMSFRVNNMDRQIQGLNQKLHTSLGALDGDGSGDFDAYARAFKAKNGHLKGALMAWQDYKRKSPSTPWRQMFPELQPPGKGEAAAPSSSTTKPDPLGLRGGK